MTRVVQLAVVDDLVVNATTCEHRAANIGAVNKSLSELTPLSATTPGKELLGESKMRRDEYVAGPDRGWKA